MVVVNIVYQFKSVTEEQGETYLFPIYYFNWNIIYVYFFFNFSISIKHILLSRILLNGFSLY